MVKLLLHELGARRGALIGWSIGLSIFGGYIIILYPEFSEPLAGFNLDDIALYQALGNFGDMATLRGFISAEMFIFLPVLLAVYAIINGTGTLAGEEDNGTLEPQMALPIPRWQLLTSKFLALAVVLLVILLVVSISLVVAFNSLSAEVNVGDLEAADLVVTTLSVWPLVLLFSTLSLFLGAIVPTRRIAASLATVILVISYFGNNFANFVEPLENLQPLFAFYYFDGNAIMAEGLMVQDSLILLGASLVFLLLALVGFERRNVTVGTWPWVRPRITTD